MIEGIEGRGRGEGVGETFVCLFGMKERKEGVGGVGDIFVAMYVDFCLSGLSFGVGGGC